MPAMARRQRCLSRRQNCRCARAELPLAAPQALLRALGQPAGARAPLWRQYHNLDLIVTLACHHEPSCLILGALHGTVMRCLQDTNPTAQQSAWLLDQAPNALLSECPMPSQTQRRHPVVNCVPRPCPPGCYLLLAHPQFLHHQWGRCSVLQHGQKMVQGCWLCPPL